MAKRKKMPTKMAPGTKAGNEYLNKMDRERRRRGLKGRTIKGKRATESLRTKRYKRKKST